MSRQITKVPGKPHFVIPGFVVPVCLVLLIPVMASAAPGDAGIQTIDRADYADKLRAMWIAESIANWTGLRTENIKKRPPFYTDEDWGKTVPGRYGPDNPRTLEFVIQDPWLADDDTDIEYIYVHAMAKKGPIALKLAKDCINKSFETTLAEGLEYERKVFYMLFATEDQKEGMRAFVEKRPPQFKGK